MPSRLPNHPLFDQLCNKASIVLPELGFDQHEKTEGKLSFIATDGLVLTIEHNGYDMPDVFFGYQDSLSIFRSWGPLEYYIDETTPVFKKHTELKSFYDLAYEVDLLKNYHQEICQMVREPEGYMKWLNSVDIEFVFAQIKG